MPRLAYKSEDESARRFRWLTVILWSAHWRGVLQRVRPMAWFILFIAGICEIGWAIGLKYTDGFSRLMPSLLTGGAMLVSIVLLGIALKTLPVGTGYAVWTGIGAVGTAILGIFLFGESTDIMRLASIGLIVAGIIGLKVFTVT